MNYQIYPLVYYPYMMGSSLGYFISLHDGFYPYSFGAAKSNEYDKSASNDKVRHSYDSSILRFDKTYDDALEVLKPFDKKYKYVMKSHWSHMTLDETFNNHIGKTVFPIIIKINKRILNYATNYCNLLECGGRDIWPERFSKIKIENDYFYEDEHVVNLYNTKNKDDFLILDILKLYENDNTEYFKLCNFLGTNARTTAPEDFQKMKSYMNFEKCIDGDNTDYYTLTNLLSSI